MKSLLVFIAIFSISSLWAQEATVSGKVIDNITKQPVPGAKVQLTNTLRAKSDFDGNYTIMGVPFGKYSMEVTMLSFDTTYYEITVDKADFTFDILLGGSKELEEVEVIGSIAVDRKTPVAVTTLGKKEISEELGSQDLPMVLNSKPGVHATQTGGGDGDARITIRGFDQRNVGVMIDGVPVNDMENGWVYWSNWFGLDNITGQIQVQRGLGATKLAMPSVGGSMNILTQNTGGKREIKVRQEYGTGTFLRTSLAYKSGTLKNGWGVLFSGSYKQGNGYVDGLYTLGAFYYLKVQKKIGDHVVSLSGFGAPQRHGQRSYNQPIAYWDADYARKVGVADSSIGTTNINHGIRFNQHWGYYTDPETGKRVQKNERYNYYHKPQITLKDFWKVNDKLSWSNIAYMSIGRGGGARARNSTLLQDSTGQIDWDGIVHANQYVTFGGMEFPTVDPAYDPTLLKSSQVMTSAVNNHMWIGGISQIDYKVNSDWNIAAGLDYRYYKGTHYRELIDLLGGDYWINNGDKNAASPMKVVGDKIGWETYHNYRDAFEQWVGGFGQAEYSKGRWAAFVNTSFVVNGYNGVDYFMPKELHDGDTTIYVAANDTVTYNGQTYTNDSPELVYNSTGWKWLAGATIKAGANFNVTEKSNIFMNVGYLNRTPQYSNVIDNNTNTYFLEILNERIYATELGYGFRSKKMSVNVNGYYTYWENKPFPFGVSVIDPKDPTEYVQANVNGMDALHVGAELDAVYIPHKKITLEGMVSYGDWTWQSSDTIDVLGTKIAFDAKGVHVGDAAQSTYAASVRYAIVKGGYIKVKYTYFDRYFSNFNPFDLQGANGGRESWQIPSYGLLSIHAGYRYSFEKSSLIFRGNIFNVLNTMYISDARNNQNGSSFDATSAGVFMGQGMRFNVSLGFEF